MMTPDQHCEEWGGYFGIARRDASMATSLERGRGRPRRPHRVSRETHREQYAEQHGAQAHVDHQPRRRLTIRELGPALVEDPVLDALEACVEQASRRWRGVRDSAPGKRTERKLVKFYTA